MENRRVYGENVLLVDDAAFMRMVMRDMVTKCGYNVVGEASNGKEAIMKYNDLRPDIVLMDITMPELDGIQAVKGIKMMDRNAKIIMCSAMGQHAMVIEAIQAGAIDFIVKPCKPEKLAESLKAAEAFNKNKK